MDGGERSFPYLSQGESAGSLAPPWQWNIYGQLCFLSLRYKWPFPSVPDGWACLWPLGGGSWWSLFAKSKADVTTTRSLYNFNRFRAWLTATKHADFSQYLPALPPQTTEFSSFNSPVKPFWKIVLLLFTSLLRGDPKPWARPQRWPGSHFITDPSVYWPDIPELL